MELSNLVFNKDGQVVTDSLIVAKYFEKDHKNVIRAIKELAQDGRRLNFEPSNYVSDNGHINQMYLMNKKGFLLLIMGFTGQKALDLKEQFIDVFEEMESFIKSRIFDKSFQDPMISAADIAESVRRIAKVFNTPESIANVEAAKYIKKKFDIDLTPMLCNNESSEQDDRLNPTDLGKFINKSARAMNILLLECGLQIKLENGNWSLTEKGKSFGTYLDTAKKHSDGTPIQQIKWYKEKTLKFLSENEINEDEE